MQEQEVCWDIRTAAGYLAMSPGFVRKRVRQRSIPFFRVGKKALRFRKNDLDKWLEENSFGAEVSYGDKAR